MDARSRAVDYGSPANELAYTLLMLYFTRFTGIFSSTVLAVTMINSMYMTSPTPVQQYEGYLLMFSDPYSRQ